MASRSKKYKTCKHTDCKRMQNAVIQHLYTKYQKHCGEAGLMGTHYIYGSPSGGSDAGGACWLAENLYRWFIKKYGEGA